jgi:hypothetical protein
LFHVKAYGGGKDITNNSGSVLDYVYKNKLINTLTIIEIKTPLTPLIGQLYRNNTYAMSKELSGAINQVIHYKDKLIKEFAIQQMNSNVKFEVLDPKCLIVTGNLSNLNESELKTFELFRRELRSIEIITYDELFEKIKILIS